jgi:uncharacterized protein (DUF1697 family)
MSDLRDLAGRMGFENPRTLLQSGNLVFSGKSQKTDNLENVLEKESKKRFSHEIRFVVRTAAEWESLISRNPFPGKAKTDPGHFVVMCFKEAPGQNDVKTLRKAITGPEVIRTEGREGYILYPAGIGTSRLTLALIESKLGTTGTARNWNTVMKIAALAGR